MRKGKARMVETIVDHLFALSDFPASEYAAHRDDFEPDAKALAEDLYADGFHQYGQNGCGEVNSKSYSEGFQDGFALAKSVVESDNDQG